MTRDEIIGMAREAGFQTWESKSPCSEGKVFVQPIGCFCNEELERFAALVAAKAAQDEREACAMVCSGIADSIFAIDGEDDAMCAACDCEESILARGR